MRAFEPVWLALVVMPPILRGGESPVVLLGVTGALMVAWVLWLAFRLPEARPIPTELAVPLAAGALWAALATWTSVHPTTSLWELGWWLALGALVRIVAAELPGTEGLIRLQAALVVTATLIAAYGLLETYAGSDEILGAAKSAYRGQVSGTFVNPSHMASYLVLALPAALACAAGARSAPARAAGAFAAVVLAAALVLSRSRGGWIASLAGAAVLGTFSLRARAAGRLTGVLALVAAGVALGLLALPGTLPALASRVGTLTPGQDAFGRAGPWGAALQLTCARPLTGWGPGTYAHAFLAVRPPGYYFRPSHAHQELLELGVELGVPGLALGLALGFALARRAVRAAARLPHGATLPHAALVAGAAGFLCTCLWDWPLHVPATALAFATVCGALAAPTRQGPEPAPRARAFASVAAALALALAAPLTDRWIAEARLARARAAVRAGDLEGARATFAAVRARWPSLWTSALEEVELCQLPPGAAVQATQAALAAVRAAPDLSDPWRALGGALVSVGLFEPAADAYAEAARLDPASHLPLVELGNVRWALGCHPAAVDAYRAALDAYPVDRIGQFPEIVTQMTPVAQALAAPDARGLPDAVVSAAMRVLELRKARAPADFRSYRLLEDLYRRLGLPDEERQEAAAETRATGR